MIPCEVISDLMVVIEAGEASPETIQLVAGHLETCPACREAYAGKLAATNPVQPVSGEEPPAATPDGQRFVTRTRQRIFAWVGGFLLVSAILITLGGRGLAGLLGEDLYFYPVLLGDNPLVWSVALPLTLAFAYLGTAWGSTYLGPTNRLIRLGLAALCTILFFASVLFGFAGLAAGNGWQALVGLGGVLVMMLATYRLLPRGSHLAGASLAALLLVNLTLTASPAFVLFTGGGTDGPAFLLPSDLGHPSDRLSAAEAGDLDLEGYGYRVDEARSLEWIDNVWIGDGASAHQRIYTGPESPVSLTLVRFRTRETAGEFFTAWMKAREDGLRIGSVSVNLPGIPSEGQYFRAYLPLQRSAVMAWQNGNWAILISAQGAYPEALKQANHLARLATEQFGSQ